MALTPVNLPISPLPPVSSSQNISSLQNGLSPITDKEISTQTDFAGMLDDALQKLDNLQKDADKSTLQLASGQIQDVHSTIIALEKANLGFSLAVEVRNKVLDAYHEAMRMQL